MGRNDLLAWVLIGVGAFSIGGGVFDWDWFMNNRKAWLWVRLFGRKRARIFYVVLGGVIAGAGVWMLER